MTHTIELDTETRDLRLDTQQQITSVSDADEKAQTIRLLLSTFRGEWAANPSHGTDHWAYIGQPYNPQRTPALAQAVIREALMQEPRISEVVSVTTSFDRADRNLIIVVRAIMDGEEIETEVDI